MPVDLGCLLVVVFAGIITLAMFLSGAIRMAQEEEYPGD